MFFYWEDFCLVMYVIYVSVGSRVLSSCSDSSSLYSAGSGVKSVVIVLLALSFRSFAFVQVCTSSKYG